MANRCCERYPYCFCEPVFTEAEVEAIMRVVESGRGVVPTSQVEPQPGSTSHNPAPTALPVERA